MVQQNTVLWVKLWPPILGDLLFNPQRRSGFPLVPYSKHWLDVKFHVEKVRHALGDLPIHILSHVLPPILNFLPVIIPLDHFTFPRYKYLLPYNNGFSQVKVPGRAL